MVILQLRRENNILDFVPTTITVHKAVVMEFQLYQATTEWTKVYQPKQIFLKELLVPGLEQ